ncbi:hypothetical protein ACS7SF_25560 (plasmid) [Ralstonia sp. 25C]|uniref:hypothetical protein n=1 Tax=Ralstonia sp. 25C TaxID=3447363 RepID=UPI003F75135E
MPSSTACIGRAQANNVCLSLQRYRSTLPPNQWPNSIDQFSRADGWHIGTELLNGDFDLDPVLAAQLIGSMVAASEQTPATANGGTSWMLDYLYGSPSGKPGTAERYMSEARNAAFGPGGLLANLNTGMSAAHASHGVRLEKSIQAGAQKILSGQSNSVRISPYATLYNANTSGKGRPRPKIRITNMPIETVQPALLGQNGRINARTQVATATVKNANLRELAPKVSPLSRMYIRGGGGNAVLTFAPSLVLDTVDSIHRDTNGKLKFDTRRFAIASARSQSGNLVGFITSGAITTGVGIVGGAALAASAPIILVALIAGVAVQMVWGASGKGDDLAEFVQQKLGE